MIPRPISNPPNPWSSTEVEYLEQAPDVKLQVFEDHTKQILAHNDSPDLGFSWSVNPYRGCFHACSYCLGGDTPILLGDGRTVPIRDLRVGAEIYGTTFDGKFRRYTRTRVVAKWSTIKPAYRITLEDDTELIASGDHRFLTNRGWKYVLDTHPVQRPHLTTQNELMGVGGFAGPPIENNQYKRGYLCGIIRGDAHLAVHRYARPGRKNGDQYHFRLALIDIEPLQRTRRYLRDIEIETNEFVFTEATASRGRMLGIRTHARSNVQRLQRIVEWPTDPSLDWTKGFLAGIFDAEGCFSTGILRISNSDEAIIRATTDGLQRLGFNSVIEPPHDERGIYNIRVRSGLGEHLRFFHTVGTAIARKRDIEGRALKSAAKLRVISIEPISKAMTLYDITTGTGDFIANGVVSHNCYARPTHEYLSFGAGTDFDRKIVVKPQAPELLREAFEKPSWKGELIVFSGNTDCYQPLEASYRLTRGCLEVCAEYRNPAAVITKAPLIERDIDVLCALAEVTNLSVTISIPFWDVANARAVEPYVATPERRIHVIEKLARAGIQVGVNVAPIIPGLNDEDMPDILAAARAAGAVYAGMVILRLPGPVKAVFEERIRASLPLRADKILARVRETLGGKLYDARFGKRGKATGEYGTTIKALFEATKRRLGYPAELPERHALTFRRPDKPGMQMKLF